MKRKVSVYITEEAAARLAAAAEQRGATKSGLIQVALDRFLDATDERANQASLERRLNWMSRQLEQLDRDLRIVNETAAMHVRYHLAVTPPLPKAAQHAACTIGVQRFDEFAAQVGRRVHLGRPLMRETLDRISVTNPELFASEGEGSVPLSGDPRSQEPATQDDKAASPVADDLSQRAAAQEVGSNGSFPERNNESSH
jgi:hypothetical protein